MGSYCLRVFPQSLSRGVAAVLNGALGSASNHHIVLSLSRLSSEIKPCFGQPLPVFLSAPQLRAALMLWRQIPSHDTRWRHRRLFEQKPIHRGKVVNVYTDARDTAPAKGSRPKPSQRTATRCSTAHVDHERALVISFETRTS